MIVCNRCGKEANPPRIGAIVSYHSSTHDFDTILCDELKQIHLCYGCMNDLRDVLRTFLSGKKELVGSKAKIRHDWRWQYGPSITTPHWFCLKCCKTAFTQCCPGTETGDVFCNDTAEDAKEEWHYYVSDALVHGLCGIIPVIASLTIDPTKVTCKQCLELLKNKENAKEEWHYCINNDDAAVACLCGIVAVATTNLTINPRKVTCSKCVELLKKKENEAPADLLGNGHNWFAESIPSAIRNIWWCDRCGTGVNDNAYRDKATVCPGAHVHEKDTLKTHGLYGLCGINGQSYPKVVFTSSKAIVTCPDCLANRKWTGTNA